MDFRIADTFTDSLARLTGEEQKAVKTTAFDLQLNPANPGLSFHKLNKARDKNFWSVRVSGDVRLIVHRAPGSLLLCYVDHHDGAYGWAERRKLETHPQTDAAQLLEIRERVEEIAILRFGEVEPSTLPRTSVPRSLRHAPESPTTARHPAAVQLHPLLLSRQYGRHHGAGGLPAPLLPHRRLAELYISLGFNRHGKTELYRDLARHQNACRDIFRISPGTPGMVMVVFNMPSDDLVFKIIRDRFAQPKRTTRREVIAKYDYIFRHDRTGRLPDTPVVRAPQLRLRLFPPRIDPGA